MSSHISDAFSPFLFFFPEAFFSPAENFLLICCCFSKTRQFSVINQTKFEQIIVKGNMRSQLAFFVVV